MLTAAILLIQLSFVQTAVAGSDAEWQTFKQRFLMAEGRIVDSGQNGISHSEGQGVAMLLATHYDDRASFEKIWGWTRGTLQIRDDKLLAWRWTQADGVNDRNNASDGDLYVAWALLRAHQRWQVAAYRDEALQILASVRQKLIRQDKRGPVLLPGADGFEKSEGLTVNLSYWLFPAFAEFAVADPDPTWEALSQTGINLLQEARFGRWSLPPDWLRLGDKLEPAEGFPPRFGYDAVRIPLYLLWAGRDSAQLMQPYRDYWGYFADAKFLPAWTRLNDDSVDSWNSSAGIRGIAQITLSAMAQADIPAPDAAQDYYSSTLLLLSKVMLQERKR